MAIEIREVYADNLEEEFNSIREIIDNYPLIGLDTEFPGIPFPAEEATKYKKLKINVDSTKLIQVGLTLSDDKGDLPPHGRIWQFNFCEFNPAKDLSAQVSIQLLSDSGIDFAHNMEKGVDAVRFGDLLMSSGVAGNGNVSLITFQGGYDLGYLLKILSGKSLPGSVEGFLRLLKVYFPVSYDVKHLMKCTGVLHGGLTGLADTLGLERVGVAHQAGSDSRLTSAAFVKIRDIYFDGEVEKHCGVVHGLE
ncbi:hypothetical protein SASPL_114915 [Salvia splendens]|uniref:poly(A)-specific ribonuclease n=1 Tax=Salvia splendens TaxID=180675 RepID=A0A8X9A0T6_SALSN|nr:probable CCR4-associated factor 1 homolog 10 [Salvia splendens]KAG6424497.1 hypothetical protein SASPL_114915 [Salvia splendens]